MLRWNFRGGGGLGEGFGFGAAAGAGIFTVSESGFSRAFYAGLGSTQTSETGSREEP